MQKLFKYRHPIPQFQVPAVCIVSKGDFKLLNIPPKVDLCQFEYLNTLFRKY